MDYDCLSTQQGIFFRNRYERKQKFVQRVINESNNLFRTNILISYIPLFGEDNFLIINHGPDLLGNSILKDYSNMDSIKKNGFIMKYIKEWKDE